MPPVATVEIYGQSRPSHFCCPKIGFPLVLIMYIWYTGVEPAGIGPLVAQEYDCEFSSAKGIFRLDAVSG